MFYQNLQYLKRYSHICQTLIKVRVELEKARQEDAERVAEERKEMKDEQMEDEEEKVKYLFVWLVL